MNFAIAQVMGGIALIILIISFQNNNKKILLKYQIVSSFIYGLQYLFLNAYSGFLINFMCMIRNYIFNKYEKGRPHIYWLIIMNILFIIISVFTYNGLISILPTISVIIYTFAIWTGNLKVIRFTEIIACSLYLIYNIEVYAITGFIATVVEFIAGIIAVYRFDIKKKVIE